LPLRRQRQMCIRDSYYTWLHTLETRYQDDILAKHLFYLFLALAFQLIVDM
jgi:hypothetical protein